MARPLPSRSDIETALADSRRALHPRELSSQLGVPQKSYPHLVALLDQLSLEGVIKTLPGGRVKLARGKDQQRGREKGAEEVWEGFLTVNPRGFGFVMSVGRKDVFVPAEGIYEALHGDTVQVRVVGQSPKGLEGRIEGIVARRSPRVAGVVHKKRKSSWLEPDDTRLRGPIAIVSGAMGAKDGDAAIARIIRFPDFADELPEAHIEEILGPQGDPRTEVKKILVREEVREEHEVVTLQNAEQMAELLRRPRLEGRVDLRGVPLPTIDPEDARDHDDAIWVERIRGGYRAYVAIADVAEYVREDSPLDEEARARGCTIYLPDRAIPMLPRALAADLCSLLPEVDRYCMCVIAELDSRGRTKKFEVVEAVMRSAARLTYGGVARALGVDPESPESPAAEAFKSDLFVLQELAERLRKNRMRRGSLDLDLPEAQVVLDDETGAPVEVKKRGTRPGLKIAYHMVEEMMLLANELVATWLIEKKAPAIFRVHGEPDPQKLERLATIAKSAGIRVDPDDLLEPRGAAKFLAKAHTHERSRVLEMLLLRSLKQATYDIANIGHFGLASENYVHFTSPIRRYPDLRVHRQIKRILRGDKIDRSTAAADDLRAAATESSKKERAAMDVEREVMDLYRALYMTRHIGDVFDGTVTGISGGGIYVAIDDPFVDVMIRFDELGADRFEIAEDELSVVGSRSGETITLGDTVRFEVIDVTLVRRTTYGKRVVSADKVDQDEPDWLAQLPRRRNPEVRRAGKESAGRSSGASAPAGGARQRSGRGSSRSTTSPSAREKKPGRSSKAAGKGSTASGSSGSARSSSRSRDQEGGLSGRSKTRGGSSARSTKRSSKKRSRS